MRPISAIARPFSTPARGVSLRAEEHLDDLVELAERAAHLHERVLRDVVGGVELDDARCTSPRRSPSRSALSNVRADRKSRFFWFSSVKASSPPPAVVRRPSRRSGRCGWVGSLLRRALRGAAPRSRPRDSPGARRCAPEILLGDGDERRGRRAADRPFRIARARPARRAAAPVGSLLRSASTKRSSSLAIEPARRDIARRFAAPR